MESISGQTKKDEKFWFTYHANALKATREAVELDRTLRVRSKKSDSELLCVKKSKPENFSKSLNAIVLNIFVIEYRIKRAAERERIWNKKVTSYVDGRGLIKHKSKKFKNLSLYEKWRNILQVSGKKETKKYIKSVEGLNRYIRIRNVTAHGDYKEIQKLKISPKKALRCYDAVTKAIFELNVALGYSRRKDADRSCKKMLLKNV